MIEIIVTPAQRTVCQNALDLAASMAECNFGAIAGLNYASSSLPYRFQLETFEDRMRSAVSTFTSCKHQFTPDPAASTSLRSLLAEITGTTDDPAIRLTSGQAHQLKDALELLARIHLGQFHFAIERASMRAQPTANELYHSWLTRCSGSFGIYSHIISDDARIAWDMFQVIRHHFAWLRSPTGGFAVDFDPPSPRSQEPLIVLRANP